MTCPLCGAIFNKQDQGVACQCCPLAAGCHLTRCPSCGYEWTDESQLVNWFRARWRGWREGVGHDRPR